MTIKDFLQIPWIAECDTSIPCRVMTVQIGFYHSELEYDETEFDISAYSARELAQLFKEFCKENHFTHVTVKGIAIIRSADSMEELIEMERVNL